MPDTDDYPDLTKMTYEQARSELVEVVQKLETGGVSLEESLRLWERGEALASACEKLLDGARKRLSAGNDDHTTSAS